MRLFDRFKLKLGQGEFLVGGMVVVATALLILPVPACLMDILLAINIAFAMTMLLLALHVDDVLKVAVFPTLLLVATLFRLSLNVSTTRLILLQADAGEVVRAFGSFVVRGNPLVGGVVFLILTVVQFIVIAKGSERVAEVTARFTLDAMPGKQMSIDADLRAGAIDQQQAGRRRGRLEREAQFHGAMDGAMKFVKGDAIAGMVITTINILGGLLVGTLQRGMTATDAVGAYTLLTIGDGLVSQIPALLVSTAAGLTVTRVRSEQPSATVGGQLVRQVGAHPEVLLLAGGVLALTGLVPGMPTLAFTLLGASVCGLGFIARRKTCKRAGDDTTEAARPSAMSVVVKLPRRSGSWPGFAEAIEGARSAVQDGLGIAVPAIGMSADGPAGRWIMEVDDAPVASGQLAGGASRLAEEVGDALRRSAARFVGVQETQDMLDRLERAQPALVREVVPRLVPTVLLAEILSRLVEEGIPVRNLRGILATLAEWARTEADPAVLAERVREAHASMISYLVAPEGTLRSILLDASVEHVVQCALQHNGSGTTLALQPEDGEAILTALDRALGSCGKGTVVILARPEIRRAFWKLISGTHPTVRVVSYVELDPSLNVQPTGKVSLEAA